MEERKVGRWISEKESCLYINGEKAQWVRKHMLRVSANIQNETKGRKSYFLSLIFFKNWRRLAVNV